MQLSNRSQLDDSINHEFLVSSYADSGTLAPSARDHFALPKKALKVPLLANFWYVDGMHIIGTGG